VKLPSNARRRSAQALVCMTGEVANTSRSRPPRAAEARSPQQCEAGSPLKTQGLVPIYVMIRAPITPPRRLGAVLQ